MDEAQIWPSAWPKGVPVRREAVQAATSLGGTAGLHHLSAGNKESGSLDNKAKHSSDRGNRSLQRHPAAEARRPGGPERPHHPPRPPQPPAAATTSGAAPARPPAAAVPPSRAVSTIKASNDDDLFSGMGSRVGYRLPSARPAGAFPGPRRTTKAIAPTVSSAVPYAMRRSALGSGHRQQQQPQVLKIKEVQVRDEQKQQLQAPLPKCIPCQRRC